MPLIPHQRLLSHGALSPAMVSFGNAPTTQKPRPPFSVTLNQNQVLNRMVIEGLGLDVWWLAFARNKFERQEKALDIGVWWVMGLIGPIVVDRMMNRQFIRKAIHPILPKSVDKTAILKALRVPFEWLDASRGEHALALAAKQAGKSKDLLLKTVGIPSVALFNTLKPTLLRGKLRVVFVDLLMLMASGQSVAWLKNWLTQKQSGKVGFSGEFNYATQTYQAQQSKNYHRQEKYRKWLSSGIGIASILVFPWLLGRVVRASSAMNKGLIGNLKKIVPAFNYHNAIYMSRWLLLYSTIFNYNIPMLLASRDKHEFRETLTKHIALDFFFYIGDDVLSALGSAWLTRRFFKNAPAQSLVSSSQKFMGLPAAKPLAELWKTHGAHSKTYRLARLNYWAGLIGTSLFLGISTPLLNNWFTRKAVLKEQGELMQPTSSSSEHSIALEHAHLYRGFERSAPQAQQVIHP